MEDKRLTPQYVGRQNPCRIFVYSFKLRCLMVRLKPKDKPPSPVGLTAIFTITYHGKR